MKAMIVERATMIGLLLKAVRISERLSQEGLAGLSGVAHTRISRYERFVQVPDLDTIFRLLDAAGWEIVLRRKCTCRDDD